MSLRHALLGLLADEAGSGYDLTRKFERSLQRYAWHAQHSQIYPELNRLAHEGLAEVVDEGARGRRTYAITDAGRVELRHWMMDPPDMFAVRNEFVLRMFLLSTLDPHDAIALLTDLADDCAREAAVLRERIEAADAATPHGSPPPFSRLAAEFGVRSFELSHDWAVWAVEVMTTGRAPDPV